MCAPSIVFVALATVGFVNAQGSLASWHPAGPGDSRGPCPMLNTLANHGFLPREGRNFTLPIVKHALGTGLNVSDDITEELFNFALTTNPAPNATTWGLDTLGNHNILEHDASLRSVLILSTPYTEFALPFGSRSDKYFTDDAVTFNSTVYDQTRAYWTGDLIDIQMAANARLARMIDSVKYNPRFALSELAGEFSAGEGAGYMLVFGNRTEKTARRDLVEYFFKNERLPTELGWKIPTTVISLDDLNNFSEYIINATSIEAL
ncbi:Cloroperoxidase [Clathrospora elynae]|uniref:Cloroperoxidase n=1 Tax=Clathrospora elynae TaxID=706981 RepID=A0A6A5SMN5_9PLEO|nr:Cloroperoxidase [Clathrospora elynae]